MFVPGGRKSRKLPFFFSCGCSDGKLTLLGLWVGGWALFLLEDGLLGGRGSGRKGLNCRKKKDPYVR